MCLDNSQQNFKKTPAVKIAVGFIKLYRLLLSPILGRQCRYYPTCSHYGEEAICRFGVIKGSYLTAKRIFRCAPWGKSGYDPVPLNSDNQLVKPLLQKKSHKDK